MGPTTIRKGRAGALLLAAALLAGAATAAGVRTMSPQGEVAKIRQARVTFSDSMVRFGDPRLPDPFELHCAADKPPAGNGRWVDDKTWVYDFAQDLAAGTRCTLEAKPGLKSLVGDVVTGATRFEFGTGGPAIVRAYPQPDEDNPIEEEQVFALLLNGAATKASIEKYAYCEAGGVGEKIPVQVVDGPVRADILKAVKLVAQQARVAMLRCARPLAPESTVSLVWARGIATPSGVANSSDRRLAYKVRPAFAASFTCERINARADCLPIRPLRLEFSSPVPRRLAERIVLKAADGDRRPRLEQGRGEEGERLYAVENDRGVRGWLFLFSRSQGKVEDKPSESPVSAVEFKGDLPENASIRIELPPDFRDDSGRALSNADEFPLASRTAEVPPLAKFPRATFGILELNAEPVLPLTVRRVEGDLAVKGYTPAGGAVRDLKLADDAAIIEWLARVKRYDETRLQRRAVEAELNIRLPPAAAPASAPGGRAAKRYGRKDDDEERPDPNLVETRSVSLLNTQAGAARLGLPAASKTDPHPLEVIGIPMPEPGFHVVEVESPRLGRALLDRAAPMYVRTSVLVTNLGVHFKWGAVNSGVWVTTLDKAQPVAGAQIRISDCRGQPVWSGTSDARGFALVPQALPPIPWGRCARGDDDSRENGYFVSARKTDEHGRADMAFVWSTWNQGIESWRFHIDGAERAEPEPAVYHSVFDRTLLRAGQTVSMKHYARTETLSGLRLVAAGELPDRIRIVHVGSQQKFEFPLEWRQGRYAETQFKIPADAKLGLYQVSLVARNRSFDSGDFRVEEFRIPVMTGRIVPPRQTLIQPRELPLSLQIEYGNGGGAAGLAVQVSAQLSDTDTAAAIGGDRYPGFHFDPPREPRDPNARPFFSEDYVDEDDEADSQQPRDARSKLVADKIAATLDKNGAAAVTLARLPEIRAPRELLVQATYADPNGETQTLSRTLPVWPSGLVLGVRTDSWVSVTQKVAAQVLALDTAGKPQAGVALSLHALAHRTTSTRKRLVGGFYAYDNQESDEDLGEVCKGKSDARGLVLCEVRLDRPGEIELVAQASDSGGHAARAAASIWVTREGEVWFGGDNQDRIDVIPEQRSYEPGQIAKFQVRSPFRHATALVAIERNGILETRVVALDGKDPTIELPVKAEWAPNVYVSVLAVRGRVREVPWYSFFVWGWRTPAEWWRAWRDEGPQYQAPTAMVDLSKPAFKYGIGAIQVGNAAHRLRVEVQPDKTRYAVRATSRVRVRVRLPDGRPAPAGTEVALAAVDEALLELRPNDSWDLLGAMIRQRGYAVETATAQMQIIGKRHYGKKAAPAGGGGGQFPTRELFDTLLLWNPRVALDANGEATVEVPLNDSLTRFRIVAIADAAQGADLGLFGSGQADIATTQDLQIVSGVPPLVREGDRYRAMFTLRNSTAKALDAVLSGSAGAALPEQKLHIEAGGSVETGWDVAVPFNVEQIEWQVGAQAGAAQDRMKFTQAVAEAVPVTVQQATLAQLDGRVTIPIAPPQGALADAAGSLRGGVSVALVPRLADGLEGVRDYLARYPWPCLEQKASVAIGLRDVPAWNALAGRIPLYLDADGLANYFPSGGGSGHDGSDSLTAYLLALSDEVSRLGYPMAIPEATREQMERGLIAFVEGRIKRDFWTPAFLKNGDLDVRKLAALEALSRSGHAQPRMLESIQILPNQWPTGALIDWLALLGRMKDVPDRDHRIAEAEQILRARLNVQGTRLGFSTERDDSWWWLMSNGDVNAVRMVLDVLDKPGWKDDMPRLVAGTLQREQFGHWSTTVANAWGTLAMEAFSKRFERGAVTGSTRAGFEPAGPAQTLDWSRSPQGGTLSLGWPPGFASVGRGAPASLVVSQQGTGRPWLTTTSRAAVPVLAPFGSGYRITKTVTPVEQKAKGRMSRGDLLRVHLDIDVQADATWVVVSDPIPAGATLLGSGLGRDSVMATNSERTDDRGWLAYQERSFEAYRAFYRYLPKGHFNVEYTMRLNNAGRFGLPQTRVEAMYAPEMFGEAPNAAVIVEP